jgi:hypothetical protein
MSPQKHKHRILSLSRPMAIAALIAGGSFQLVAPALAAPGGLDIVNRATATYTDGATTPTTYSATSNTVTIRVQEVAGITLAASTPSKTAPKAGETLYVDFTITNTGFDTTQFFIPDTATLSDSANFSINGPLKVMSVNGVAQGTTGVTVPTGGGATGDTAKFTFTGVGAVGGSIPVGSTVVVRVPIQVLGSATTANTLKVALGNTATPDANGNENNVVRVNGAQDVYTVDNPDTVAGEYPGTPFDTREAMATSATISVAARYQAFATVLKATGGYDPGTTPNLLSDDKLTYNLALRVENPSSPPAGLAPSDLYGTAIKVDSATVNRVLVSDAIPAGTQLDASNPTATASNWQVVYTTDAVTGTGAKTALAASWTTIRPTTGTITRVGFIYNTDATTASPAGNGPIVKGSAAVTGFSFKVNPLASFTGGPIANMAQALGQSQPGAVVTGTATQIVYDESGDQSSNNSLGGADPTALTDSAGGINDGLTDPAKDGTDPGTGSTDPTNASTNTGTDTAGTDTVGGEATVYTIAAAPFTGPLGTPEAVGPGSDNNKDYTNKSIVLPLGLDPALPLDNAQTTAVVFDNTVKNASTAQQTISLVPSLPSTFGSNELALPDGSTVTIDPDGSGPAASVVFTYTGGAFTLPVGVSAPTVSVNAGASQNYTVTIDPKSGTQLKGYPVIVTAFVDGNGNGIVDTTDPSNQSIDSYYTGYVKLLKDAKIVEADGSAITSIPNFTTDALALGAEAKPNRIIKYRIRYENISTGSASDPAGNQSLSANDLTIKEDGADGTNNWFASTNDTVSPVSGGNGSLAFPSGSTVTTPLVPNGTVANDIQVYTVNVGNVLPGSTGGEVTFDRKIKQ